MKNLAFINSIKASNNTLGEAEHQQLAQLISQLNPNQNLWLSGYLAALAETQINSSQANSETHNTTVKNTATQNTLTVLYGSQTGNGKSVATQVVQQAQALGLETEIFSLADFKVKQLRDKSLITLIVSTHGEGDAPDDAELFHEQLFGAKAPDLQHLKYSVLALGDSSYELFCQTGKEMDHRLAELGAESIHPRVDCDVDFEASSTQWIDAVLPNIKKQAGLNTANDNIATLPIQAVNQGTVDSNINKHNPYQAEVLTIQKITGRESTKDTFHLELAIDPELIQYQPGDSVGVIAHNHDDAVKQLMEFWQASADESYAFKEQYLPLQQLLTEHIEITQISKPFIQFLAGLIDNSQLKELASSHQSFMTYCENHQLIDVLQSFDPEHQIPITDILNQLRNITPRLYSIASAQSCMEDELHLTINLAAPTPSGHFGLASGQLCKTASVGDEISIYIEPNHNFRLPDDETTDVIMIGPGTGIAPFRSFMQQRTYNNAPGKNWLFFGNPHFSSDFLYQSEWLKLQKSGHLDHIDVAFSRDQVEKVYVQDKLKEQAATIWQWLENGAHLYLCGDAKSMAKDVELTLLEVIQQQSSVSIEGAKTYLKNLKRANRFQQDVY